MIVLDYDYDCDDDDDDDYDDESIKNVEGMCNTYAARRSLPKTSLRTQTQSSK